MLPQKFTERMQDMLGNEYPAFLESYKEDRIQGLRVNTLKGTAEDFLKRAPFALEPIPWSESGFYYDSAAQPGKHPYHEAGVYYIQEPSAMAAVIQLDIQPGQRVLDLCAAPGGKSTQIAAAMEGSGILISNEIHPARAKILSENVERMGVINAVVTNESPDRLAERFTEYFDRILVDAPCSGEGMFRKNPEACEHWSEENVALCAARQDEILDCAAGMLKPGGRMVYSTCTFAPEEDEGTACRFLRRHGEFSMACADRWPGFDQGCPKWADGPAEGLEQTVRLWPHRVRGEGHFIAVFEKKRGDASGMQEDPPAFKEGKPETDFPDYLGFKKQYLRYVPEGICVTFGDQLYLVPQTTPSLKGLKVLRPGLHLGTLKKNRFEPSHALALSMRAGQAVNSLDLECGDKRTAAYINGEAIPAGEGRGWYLVTVDGYSLGWGKLSGAIMKNHYPKGLRKNLFRAVK